uniref:TauD/TfdA-like domain-containing protein n=1 Tax=Auxenochlorella protothecoides TaxID=3075 RepID=A0A1D1ZWM7_AUXPR
MICGAGPKVHFYCATEGLYHKGRRATFKFPFGLRTLTSLRPHPRIPRMVNSAICTKPLPAPPSVDAKLFKSFGVEVVSGFDPTDFTPEQFIELERLLYEHDVVLFRGLDLAPEHQYKLTKAFDPTCESYGHGNNQTTKQAKSVLHPDLKTIPSVPQVQLIGNGIVHDHWGLAEAKLKHPHHRTFHKDPVSEEDEAAGATRFYRWHIDAALYGDLAPPKVDEGEGGPGVLLANTHPGRGCALRHWFVSRRRWCMFTRLKSRLNGPLSRFPLRQRHVALSPLRGLLGPCTPYLPPLPPSRREHPGDLPVRCGCPRRPAPGLPVRRRDGGRARRPPGHHRLCLRHHHAGRAPARPAQPGGALLGPLRPASLRLDGPRPCAAHGPGPRGRGAGGPPRGAAPLGPPGPADPARVLAQPGDGAPAPAGPPLRHPGPGGKASAPWRGIPNDRRPLPQRRRGHRPGRGAAPGLRAAAPGHRAGAGVPARLVRRRPGPVPQPGRAAQRGGGLPARPGAQVPPVQLGRQRPPCRAHARGHRHVRVSPAPRVLAMSTPRRRPARCTLLLSWSGLPLRPAPVVVSLLLSDPSVRARR